MIANLLRFHLGGVLNALLDDLHQVGLFVEEVEFPKLDQVVQDPQLENPVLHLELGVVLPGDKDKLVLAEALAFLLLQGEVLLETFDISLLLSAILLQLIDPLVQSYNLLVVLLAKD